MPKKSKHSIARSAHAESGSIWSNSFNFFDLAPVCCCVISGNGLILEANKAAGALLGMEHSALINQPITCFIFKEDRDVYLQLCKQLFKSAEPQKRELRMLRKGSAEIWMRIEAAVAQKKEGDTACIVVINDITGQKQAEEALRESEDRFNKIFEETHVGIVISSPSFIIERANPAFCRMIGYSAEELASMTFADITHSDHIKQDMENVKKVGSGEISFYQTEKRYIHKNGKIIWTNIIVSSIRNENGVLQYYLTMVNDITDRKLAEEALRESELKYRTLFKSMSQGFYLSQILYDKEGLPCDYMFIDVNSAFEQMIGLKKEQIIGKTYNELVPPDPDSGWPDCFKRVASTGKPENYTFPSNIYNTYFEVYAFRPEEGKFAALVKDISKQKQVEEQLRKYHEQLEELVKERTEKLEKINIKLQSEITGRMQMEQELAKERNMLRTLIDNLPDEIYVKDIESKFIMANSNVIKSLRRNSLEDIIGKTDYDLLPHEQAIKCYSNEQNLLASTRKMINYEEYSMDEFGKIRWSSVTKAPLRNNQNEITGLVGINRDITAFKLAEESLQKSKEAAEAANLAKSTFLSSMSHEIRTPLNSILGFSQLMIHAENLNREQIEWLETINRSGEHLLTLINDILEISKIEAGRTVFNPSGFNLHLLLNDIESMNRIKAEAKNLTLLVELPDDLPKLVVTDEVKLRQILINILGNAVKFTHEGGIVLRVRTANENNGKITLTAEVEDTGPGISNEDIDKLFQAFRQSEAGIKEGGTGLGLVISRQYAKIMGGDITVKSQLGKGTCFTIIINIEKFDESLNKIDLSEKRVIGLEPGQPAYRILIADDRKENRTLLSKMLLTIGFEVTETLDGKETIEKFQTWSPDIILMDMRMPVIDGYEATRRIKAMDKKKTPIIAVTASAFYEDRLKALEAGANEYLRKPYKEHEILNYIQSYLGVRFIYEK